MAAHVQVVDDDPAERRHIEAILTSQGHSVETMPRGAAALARLAKAEALPVSAMILDLVMPDLDPSAHSAPGGAPCQGAQIFVFSDGA